MHKTGKYNTHRVKPIGRITTSQVSRNDHNKFRVKSIKSENYMEKAQNYGTTTEISRTSS